MKKNTKFIAIGLLVVLLIFALVQSSGLSRTMYQMLISISRKRDSVYYLNLINIVLFLVFGGVFGFLGYKLARKKKRNTIGWTLLCVFFNLWAFLILYYLPYKRDN